MQKGDRVQHKTSKRLGRVHSFSKKHPGWIKIKWDDYEDLLRFEEEDLILQNDSESSETSLQAQFDKLNEEMTPEHQQKLDAEIRERIRQEGKGYRHPGAIK